LIYAPYLLAPYIADIIINYNPKRLDMKKKHALILTWSGFQDHELVYPYYRLLGDGFVVDTVAEKRDEQGRIYGIFGLNMPCQVLMSDFIKNIDQLF
jgi:putative intracellular protease/amidase